MTKVSREQFWARIMGETKLDIVSRIAPGPYPYTSVFELRDRTPVGRIVAEAIDAATVRETYYLAEVAP